MLTAVLVLAGCVDDSDTNSPFGSASSAESASDSQTALPKISDQQIEGSCAMDLMAAVRRLDDIASQFANMKELSASQVEEIDRDQERLKGVTPLEGEATVYKQYTAVSDEVRGWADAGPTVDVLPTKKRIKALRAALRIDSPDFHNEPLMRAYNAVSMLAISPNEPSGVQKLKEADELAAKPGTDGAAAELTQKFLAKLRQLVESPGKELQREVVALGNEVRWHLKLDSYRSVQLWKADREAKRGSNPFHNLRRPSISF